MEHSNFVIMGNEIRVIEDGYFHKVYWFHQINNIKIINYRHILFIKIIVHFSWIENKNPKQSVQTAFTTSRLLGRWGS
jgi:hypothetical protein